MITERSMNIIVTAGGTSEPIDNVRRIANTGTGRLGRLDRPYILCLCKGLDPPGIKAGNLCGNTERCGSAGGCNRAYKKICDPWSRAQHGSQRLQSPFGIND